MLRFSSIISSLRTHRYLFICVLVISFFQSFVLAIGALDINSDLVTDKHISLYGYVTRFLTILFMIIIRMVPLTIIQSIFTLFYCRFRQLKYKRIVSAVLWLLPLSPALIIPAIAPVLGFIYLLYSPIYSIGVIVSFFDGSLSSEDYSEGWIFSVSALGFYYLFWLSILIKNFIFNDDDD